MNDTISLLMQHRSYRDFDANHSLPQEYLHLILGASRQAASWMNGQAYSIMVIDDPKLKEHLAQITPGNPQIGTCSAFLIYLLDMKRMEVASTIQNATFDICDDIDSLLVATTDASLAMQNAIIAAESLGYGTVCIGSIRKVADQLIELLNLPNYVYPLCGLCIGKPIVEMNIKPRLPQDSVVFFNQYNSDVHSTLLTQYDETMQQFGEARETKLWTKKFADYHQQNSNPLTNQNLKKQGFLK